MREQYYIDLERNANILKQGVKTTSNSSAYDRSISVFEPRRFSLRECRPVVRRRSLQELWGLIEG